MFSMLGGFVKAEFALKIQKIIKILENDIYANFITMNSRKYAVILHNISVF